jgi:hypothetical protein
VRQAVPLARAWSSKAQLARLPDLPRQRLQVCPKAKTACLDADRTLLLPGWLAVRDRACAFPAAPRTVDKVIHYRALR